MASGAADPYSFTAIRLISGAAALAALLALGGKLRRTAFNVPAVISLYAYVALFFLAYVALDAATGALLLFAAVQLTIVGMACLVARRAPAANPCGRPIGVIGKRAGAGSPMPSVNVATANGEERK